MRDVVFDPDAWEDFQFWLSSDRKTARRIDDEHRLVYRADEKEVKIIIKTRYHY